MAWHARKSASGSKGWINCPGRIAYEASLPADRRRPAGAAAMTGTCAHGLGEHCLRTGQTDAHWALGMCIWLDAEEDAHLEPNVPPEVETRAQLEAHLGRDVKFMVRVDEKMAEGVQLYLDVVWADLAEMGEGTDMLVEERFDMDWLRPGMGGTSDCTLYQFLGLLRVIDYKNGYVAVDAEGNTQGPYYGLGMAQRVDWLFDELEVVIVQPNSQDGRDVKRWRMTRAEVEAFRDMLAEASDRVDEACAAMELCADQADFMEWASTYLVVGDGKHCAFCDGQATCPASKAKAEELAMADFADDPFDVSGVDLVDEEALDRLGRLVAWGPYLDALVKAAQTLGQRRLEQGLEVPGHKLVAGKAPNRSWGVPEGDVVKAIVAVKPDAKVFEDPKPPKIRSPAQLEKLGKAVKELVNGVADKETGEWLKGKEPLAVRPPVTKYKMVPESDPRQAVTPTTAADDFVDDLPWEAPDA